MQIKCEYCDSFLDDAEPFCPSCGAPNDNMMRSANGVPKTIEQLQQFCASKNLPLEQMRFFIGQDYKGARAFGIYRAGDGNVVVYKNKADGTRAVRYRGTDEAYAVNELYQKLKTEVLDRKLENSRKTTYTPPSNRKTKSVSGCFVIVLIAIFLFAGCCYLIDKIPNSGYYNYNDGYYYYDGSTWYNYSNNDWHKASRVDDALNDNYTEYWQGYNYQSDYEISDFADTEYYHSYETTYDNDNDNDWGNDWDDDDDWDWGGGDWDAGGTDWDTDW